MGFEKANKCKAKDYVNLRVYLPQKHLSCQLTFILVTEAVLI